MNVADLLTRQALLTPDATAVIREDRALSYAAFEAMIWGLCRHLRDCGLRTGDVVGVHLQDPLLHLAAVLSLARSGMISVAVSATGTDTQAGGSILMRTGASAVLDDDGFMDWGGRTRVPLDPESTLALAGDPDETLRSDEPNRWMIYKTSSGTTGTPKIVGATHEGMIASIERELVCIGYPPGERYLTPVALRFDGPRRRYIACLASGATAVMPPKNGSASSLLAAIDHYDIRHYSCVPSQAYEMAAVVGPGGQRFPHMRCLRLSAGPSDEALHRLLRERLTSNLLISYGCTELGPITVASPELVRSSPRSVGRAMPGIELQVVSAEDQVLAPDTVGLIRIRAEGMPHAYHDDAEATAKYFRNGWFYPGDLGRMSGDGLLFHMGRSDDMMIMNGINIYPAEIEQTMMSHPSVRDAVAMPLKHQIVNNVPVCAVALNPGEDVSELQLLSFARGRLGAHSPRRVVILDGIPRNEHGKVQREELAQAISHRLGVRRASERTGVKKPPVVDANHVLGQLSRRISISFQPPPTPDLERLDGWLCGVLGLDVQKVACAEGSPRPDGEQLAHAWLHRILSLAELLLQGAGIPVFDASQIVACHPDKFRNDTWNARVSFALVEEMPPAAYDIAFQGALRLNAWAIARPVNEQNLQAFYSLMDERVTSKLRRMLPLGKSTLPVLRAAHRKSIPFTHLGGGVFQLGWGCKAQRISRSVTGRDSAIGALLSANKAITAMLLRKAGLPAPVHVVAANLQAAMKAAHQIGWPVVVKPVDLERGEGVVVDVSDDDRLKTAFEAACGLSRKKSAIIERQVAGVCHRLFIAHGQLLYAVKRLPMSIEGDGVADIAALVAAEIARQQRLPPWQRSGIQPIDDPARASIAAAGHTESSVPAKGELVPLRRIESTEWGGVDEEVTLRVHPENLAIALAASELFGLGMAGIDIISSDISRPWFENGAIINEVNHAPLLGGAEISRSHIPAFLGAFIDGMATIPVEVFVGGEAAWAAALVRWREMVQSGLSAYLSNAHQTLAPSGEEWRMPLAGLYRRVRALVLSARVQAIVLVVQTDEILDTGMPLEAVSSVRVVDDHLVSARRSGVILPRERTDRLIEVLLGWKRLGA